MRCKIHVVYLQSLATIQNVITIYTTQPRLILTQSLPPPPLAIATRIIYADGADDPYIQVPRVDCAYGIDESRGKGILCAMALCAYDVSKRGKGGMWIGVWVTICWLFETI